MDLVHLGIRDLVVFLVTQDSHLLVDTLALVDSVVIQESVDSLDIVGSVGSQVTVDSVDIQVYLDIRESVDIQAYLDIQVILHSQAIRDFHLSLDILV